MIYQPMRVGTIATIDMLDTKQNTIAGILRLRLRVRRNHSASAKPQALETNLSVCYSKPRLPAGSAVRHKPDRRLSESESKPWPW